MALTHLEHYQHCNCLADSAICCQLACSCHDEAGWWPCCQHCLCPPADRSGHDDLCRFGCNDPSENDTIVTPIISLTSTIILAAQDVYNELGPGHSEAVYEEALAYELFLRDNSLNIAHQVPVVIKYKGHAVGTGYIDILIADNVVIEIKAVNKISGKDELQVRKYLTATGLPSGFLINYGPDFEIVEVRKVDHEQTTSETSRY